MDNNDNHEHDPIIAFDALYTSNQLQMLKIVLPYMHSNMQRFMAIYIKLSELMLAIQFNKRNPFCDSFSEKKEPDLSYLLKYLSPYLSDAEQEMMNQFSYMQENMEQFKQMSQMMQMINDSDASPESLLQNYLSEDQLAMFKMFEEDLS